MKDIDCHCRQNTTEAIEESHDITFVFDDIKNLDDQSIRKLLREVVGTTLVLALHGADDACKERILPICLNAQYN